MTQILEKNFIARMTVVNPEAFCVEKSLVF